jgi:hypothetical protein
VPAVVEYARQRPDQDGFFDQERGLVAALGLGPEQSDLEIGDQQALEWREPASDLTAQLAKVRSRVLLVGSARASGA